MPRSPLRVLVRASYSPFVGYGNEGIGFAMALLRWGCDVSILPYCLEPPIPPELAALLTQDIRGPFDLTVSLLPPAEIGAGPSLRNTTGCNVGWTMWEWSSLDNMFEMLPDSSPDKVRRSWDSLDAIVCYDEVSKGAIDGMKHKVPTGICQGGYDAHSWHPEERDWFGPLRFCMVGALSKRKQPFLAIQAFDELRKEGVLGDDSQLTLKTIAPGLHSQIEEAYPGVKVVYESWNHRQMQAFYATQHCLLAPSQGEGKNLPCVEFLSTGGTVAATAWGGHMQWMRRDYAYPLDYLLVQEPGLPDCKSARVKLESLKAAMTSVANERGDARRKGDFAAQIMPSMCSWDQSLERFLRLVPQLVPGSVGERVWEQASACRITEEKREVLLGQG